MKEITKKQSLIICGGLFVVYSVITLIGALNHELWFDEAQAWTIARDNDISSIIRMMRYEGHPPLWHFILFVFSHLGFSCDIIPLISWAFSVATVALILFALKMPLPLKAAVVFSGGFLFTNSVISRVYCLIPFFMCLVAILYPKRREHPVLFGIAVGLLAPTHICMCGMVGILGIFMIIDLFKEWKTSSAKKNVFSIIGLLYAGAGVLMLVLPLIGSLGTNQNTADMSLSFTGVANSVLMSFYNVAVNALNPSAELNLFVTIGAALMQACFVILLILLRHWRRAFAAEIMFLLLYIATGEVIFYTNPNRAALVLFSFLFALVIAVYEEPVFKEHKPLKTDTQLIKKLLEFVSETDKNAGKSISVVLTVVLIMTAPAAAVYLFRDYTEEFSPAEVTADYIRENCSRDAVLVTYDDSLSQLAAYLPEYKIYSMLNGDFYTYASHAELPIDVDYEEVNRDLSGYDELYYVEFGFSQDYLSPDPEAVFAFTGGMKFSVNIDYIELIPYSVK